MSQTLSKANVRMWIALVAMGLITLYAWRAGWKESMFDAFCMAILAMAGGFTGAHTFESIKKPTPPVVP